MCAAAAAHVSSLTNNNISAMIWGEDAVTMED